MDGQCPAHRVNRSAARPLGGRKGSNQRLSLGSLRSAIELRPQNARLKIIGHHRMQNSALILT
jgi:hypothetical protein